MTTFEWGGYTVEMDGEATKAWYNKADAWGCECGHCRNFLALARDRQLPPELLELLDELSIPPEKATYVGEFCMVNGKPYYQVNYRLAGRILSGPESKGELGFGEKDSYPYPTDFPTPDFDLSCFLVLPWVLKEPISGPHHIILSSDLGKDTNQIEALLQEVISTALWCEGVEVQCEINVLLTDDEGIHEINLEQRNVDAPTDVLSFPMFDLEPGDRPSIEDADPGTLLVPLGDMVLNLDRARAQGKEYGHGAKREIAYLAVHSVLHLLGYDHMDEGPMKAQMRRREEAVLEELGMGR